MRFIDPAVTILLTVHMKPYVDEALASLMAQTRMDFHVVVIDSGQWFDDTSETADKMRALYLKWYTNPLVEWIFTGEGKNAKSKYCMVSRSFNRAYEEGLIRGKYFATFYDDDVYYPTFIEKMAGYLDAHSECEAVRCGENRTVIKPNGERISTPALMARDFISGQNFDCVVDGMQVMYRTSLLEKLSKPLMDENPDISSCSHSDGIFLNKVGGVIDKMHFIEETLCEHRNTPLSTFTPSV